LRRFLVGLFRVGWSLRGGCLVEGEQLNALVREGELWFISSAIDGCFARVKDLAGFGLLHQLLSRPNREIHALELLGGVLANAAIPAMDMAGLKVFRARLAEIDGEISEMELNHDHGRVDALLVEREALLEQLRGVLGKGGRVRAAPNDAERARVRATRSVKAAIDKLQSDFPALATHLRQQVRTGFHLSYVADPLISIVWQLHASVPSQRVAASQSAFSVDETNKAKPPSSLRPPLLPTELLSEESLAWQSDDRVRKTVESLLSSGSQAGADGTEGAEGAEGAEGGAFEVATDAEIAKEYGHVQNHLQHESKDSTRLLIVSGAAGAGKSRALRELARRAAASGTLVLWGGSDEHIRSPFGPFARAFSELLERCGGDLGVLGDPEHELVAVLPQFASRFPTTELDHGDGRPIELRITAAVIAAFEVLAANGSVLFVIEDLHHASPDSAALLSALLRHRPSAQGAHTLRCAVSYNPALAGPSHPAHRLMADLLTASVLVDSVELSPIGVDGVAGLTKQLLPKSHASRSAVAAWVCQQTGGNPLLSIELLRSLATQSPDQVRRTITRTDPLLVNASEQQERLRAMVFGRITFGVNSEAVRLLQVAAVLGMQCEVETLAAVFGSSAEEVLSLLASLVRTGAVVVSKRAPLRVSFAHGVVRQVLYDDLPEIERILLHRQAARHLTDFLAVDDPDRPALLAYHYAKAATTADNSEAISFAIGAGDQAMLRGAYGDAAGWFGEAERLCDEHVHRSEQLAPSCSGLADLVLRRGIAERAHGILDGRGTLLRAATLGLSVDRMDIVVEASLSASRGFFAQTLVADVAWIEMLERAVGAASEERNPSSRAELLAILASELIWAPDSDRRFALAEEALRIARALGDPLTLARVLFRLDHATATMSSISRRVDEAGEMFEAASLVTDDVLHFQAITKCAAALVGAGEVALGYLFGEEMLRRAEALDIPIWRFIAELGGTGRLLHTGCLEAAMAAASNAFSVGVRSGRVDDVTMMFSEVAVHVARWQNTLGPMIGSLRMVVADHETHRKIGYLAAAKLFDAGRPADARTSFDQAVEEGISSIPETFMQFYTLTNLAYLSARLEDTRLVGSLTERLLVAPENFPNSIATGPCGAHSLGALAALTGQWDESERWFALAEVVHAKVQAPLHLGETRLERAAMLLRRGGSNRASEARALAERVSADASPLGAVFLVEWAKRLANGQTSWT
jgi:AAA ATPase domain